MDSKEYKAIHKQTGKHYLLKQIPKALIKAQNMTPKLEREIKNMYSVEHDGILKLYNHFEDDTNVYLLMEFAKGVKLYFYIIS